MVLAVVVGMALVEDQSCQCWVLETTTGMVLGVVGTALEELQSCQWVAEDERTTGFEEVVVGFGLLELLQSCQTDEETTAGVVDGVVTTTDDQSSHLLLLTATGVVELMTTGLDDVVNWIGVVHSCHLLLSTTGFVVEEIMTGTEDVVDCFQSDQTVEVWGIGTGVVLLMIGALDHASQPPLPPPGPWEPPWGGP